jgi:hypothetical protein
VGREGTVTTARPSGQARRPGAPPLDTTGGRV